MSDAQSDTQDMDDFLNTEMDDFLNTEMNDFDMDNFDREMYELLNNTEMND